jgi:coenzyme PQQ precursor peptide PqqA
VRAAHPPAQETHMKKVWRKPRIEDIPVGLEINGYCPSAR